MAARLRAELVQRLRSSGVIRTLAVSSALSEIARERFIPEVLDGQGLEAVYSDQAFPIKHDRRGMPLSSSSQPAVMADMLELLDAAPGHRVLEVGAGTGYNAALLAHIVGDRGRVTSVDIDPQLARRARRALGDAGASVEVVVADGRAGFPSRAPYDRIIVTASAEEVPRAWFEQLVNRGRLVVPLRLDRDSDAAQAIPSLERRDGELSSVDMTWGAFMPLHGGDGVGQAPRFTLSASRTSAAGHSSLTSLSGGGLRRISDRAARRLLASMLERPQPPRARGYTPLGHAQMPIILMYLFSRIPRASRVWVRQPGRLGVGVVAARGAALGAVTVPGSLWSGSRTSATRAPWLLHSYGASESACEQLLQLIAEWRGLRRGREMLRLRGGPQGNRVPLRFSWD